MVTPQNSLTNDEYALLNYINKFDSVSKKQMLNHFNGKINALEYRLSLLAEPEYENLAGFHFPIENSNYIIEEFEYIVGNDGSTNTISKNSFHISELGKKTLQDFLSNKRSERINLWLKNAWIPIIVSLSTVLIADVLKWLLLRILQ